MVRPSWKQKEWENWVYWNTVAHFWPKKKRQYDCCWLEALSCIKKIDGGFLVTNLALERQNCVAMGKIIYPYNWQEEQCGILHLKTCEGTFSSLHKKGISVLQLSSFPSSSPTLAVLFPACCRSWGGCLWCGQFFVTEMPARETFSLPDSESHYRSCFVR